MYPLLRFMGALRRARRQPPIAPGDTAHLSVRCQLWDIDVFGELNNGRVLTLYDLGRFDYGARSGLMALLKPNGWAFAVAGASVRYRKRITAFQRIDMATRLIGRDERWFYFEQVMRVGGEPCSAMLARTGVTKRRGGLVPTDVVAEAIGQPDWRDPPPPWAAAWIDADAERPWPPETGAPAAADAPSTADQAV